MHYFTDNEKKEIIELESKKLLKKKKLRNIEELINIARSKIGNMNLKIKEIDANIDNIFKNSKNEKKQILKNKCKLIFMKEFSAAFKNGLLWYLFFVLFFKKVDLLLCIAFTVSYCTAYASLDVIRTYVKEHKKLIKEKYIGESEKEKINNLELERSKMKDERSMLYNNVDKLKLSFNSVFKEINEINKELDKFSDKFDELIPNEKCIDSDINVYRLNK